MHVAGGLLLAPRRSADLAVWVAEDHADARGCEPGGLGDRCDRVAGIEGSGDRCVASGAHGVDLVGEVGELVGLRLDAVELHSEDATHLNTITLVIHRTGSYRWVQLRTCCDPASTTSTHVVVWEIKSAESPARPPGCGAGNEHDRRSRRA